MKTFIEQETDLSLHFTKSLQSKDNGNISVGFPLTLWTTNRCSEKTDWCINGSSGTL